MGRVGGLLGKIGRDAAVAGAQSLLKGSEKAATLLHQKTAKHLLDSLGNMKGIPMKVGQILSFMDGVIPLQYQSIYRDSLAKLRVNIAPMPWVAMEKALITAYEKPLEEVFSEIDQDPLAAASIGQVYRAKTLDGTPVAVKVQYPGIRDAFQNDLKNLSVILKTLRTVLPGVDTEQMTSDFLSRFREECDYDLEAKNQQHFAKVWQDDAAVKIPKVIEDLSKDQVLVTELYDGISFEDFIATASQEEKNNAGKTLFWFVFHSMLTHGVFNGDPHPGNYLFRKNEVVFLDFGSVQQFSAESRLAIKRTIDVVLAGKRGSELWDLLVDALQFRADEHQSIRDMTEEYLLFCLKPALAEQPFTYTQDYTASVSELTLRFKMNVTKNILFTGWHEPKVEGLVLLTRIIFGLNSILASLEATADWRSLLTSS